MEIQTEKSQCIELPDSQSKNRNTINWLIKENKPGFAISL